MSLVVEALGESHIQTRSQLATTLHEAGLELSGQAVAHIVMNAEVDALIVNGPMLGKQHTYRLLEPRRVDLDRDELLATLARRCAAGHGPLRDVDLAWWTSLTLTDSRRAIELGGLRPLQHDNASYWTLDDPVLSAVPSVILLPNFDEYISYARYGSDYLDIHTSADDVRSAGGLLFVDGALAGSWTRRVATRRVAASSRWARRHASRRGCVGVWGLKPRRSAVSSAERPSSPSRVDGRDVVVDGTFVAFASRARGCDPTEGSTCLRSAGVSR